MPSRSVGFVIPETQAKREGTTTVITTDSAPQSSSSSAVVHDTTTTAAVVRRPYTMIDETVLPDALSAPIPTDVPPMRWARTTPVPYKDNSRGILCRTRGIDPEQMERELQEALDSKDVRALEEFERKWSVYTSAVQFNLSAYQAELCKLKAETTTHFVAEDGIPSSDDSDGFDPDFEEEWGPNTNDVFGACRALSVDGVSDDSVDRFLSVMREMKDKDLTTTEMSMVWDGVREFHRHSCALHRKHWLTMTTRLVSDTHYRASPSVTNYVNVLREAVTWGDNVLTPWRQRKARRWFSRALLLTYTRVMMLQSNGVCAPTWDEVHFSVGRKDRPVPIPLYTITDATKQM
eukprot:PhM_4_TR714/c0_g1_i2/m.104841